MDFDSLYFPFNTTYPSPMACPMTHRQMSLEEIGQILQLVVSFVVFTNILCTIYGFCRDPLREELQKKVDEYADRINETVTELDDLTIEYTKKCEELEKLRHLVHNALEGFQYVEDAIPGKKRRHRCPSPSSDSE